MQFAASFAPGGQPGLGGKDRAPRDQLLGPMGDYAVDDSSNYAVFRPRMARVSPRHSLDIVYEADRAVPPDPYCIAYA